MSQKKAKIEPMHIEEAQRLRRLFDDRPMPRLSQAKFGEAFEIGSQGVVWQYLHARIPLNVEQAVRFARGLNCSVSDFSPRLAQELAALHDREVSDSIRLEASLDGTVIKGGQIAVSPVLAWEHPHDLPQGDYWFVPRMEVHLSAGNGHPTPEIVTTKEQPQAFRADWLRRAKLSPAKLACMYARGDSMEPRIFDGDALLVELGETTIVDSKLYAIWYAGELRVKRLYRRPDGGLSIQSYNATNYPPIEVPADQLEHVSVIGRVRQIQTVGDL